MTTKTDNHKIRCLKAWFDFQYKKKFRNRII